MGIQVDSDNPELSHNKLEYYMLPYNSKTS